ncbi:hypothetical protein F5Y15DRAFT_412412 [Xylariaceae sp. FL0016]|nr:hypothetical protein F5Y15DRAFT_412412 [Xylariaceae sp. FL0016]
MAAPAILSRNGTPTTSGQHESAPPSRSEVDLWGIIVTEKGQRHDVRVKDDTGTPVNWIHPDLARRFSLKVEKCDRQRFEDFKGNTFKAESCVYFTWFGKSKEKDNASYYGAFYIAPERSSIDMLLGEEFVHTYGFARDVCYPKPRTRSSRIFQLNERSKEVTEAVVAGKDKNDREAREAAEARERKKKKSKQNGHVKEK